jgi:hypothetical protein
MKMLSPERRWRIRAARHLAIQLAGFTVGMVIATVFAINGNWQQQQQQQPSPS